MPKRGDLLGKLESSHLQRKDPELVRQLKCLDYVEEIIKKLILGCIEEVSGQDTSGGDADSPNLEEKDFYHIKVQALSAGELDEMRYRIIRLAHRLASLKSRRNKKAVHGRVDLRRTMVKSLATGEVPLELKYRRSKIGKPSIVILCDVSKSVLPFSEFMLLLVYALQNRFHQVRSFLFVDLVDEVTEYLKGGDPVETIQDTLSLARASYGGITDLGRVFAMFTREYLPFISGKSTVIILSDACNNSYPPEKKIPGSNQKPR